MSVLEPGTTIGGRYRIDRELAQGGYGAVYVATHTVTEERVALKVLWPHVLKSQDAVNRFQFEATIAAKIGSENIVRVLDAGFDEEKKMPFLVMELLKGKTLDALVSNEGVLRPLEVVGVLSQVASALDKAHSYRDAEGKPRPIVHRDLKPENLFFTRREGGAPSVKILDFGIAKVLSETSKASQEAKGTPTFMAYEQLAAGTVSPATDVWALGLIAFFLLTGKPYWMTASDPNADLNALFAELITSEIEPPTRRAAQLGFQPSWSAAFDAWFLRCVDRDANRRFQTTGEAIRELALAFEAADSSPDGPEMTRARTMLAVRSNLDQPQPEPLPSQTLGGQLSDSLQARLARVDKASKPQASEPPATTPPAAQHQPAQRESSLPPSSNLAPPLNPMPLVYASFGIALAVIGVLLFILLRPGASGETTTAAATGSATTTAGSGATAGATATATATAAAAASASATATAGATATAARSVRPRVGPKAAPGVKAGKGDPFSER